MAAYNTPKKNLVRGAIMPPPNIPKPCWVFVAVVEGQSGRSFVQVWDMRPEYPVLQQEVLRGHRLNARITLQASIASFGQNYQVLDRGCQPRAMGSPVQAVLAARMHATVPRLAYD